MRRYSRSAIVVATVALGAALCACGASPRYTRDDTPKTLPEVESEAAAFDNSRWDGLAASQAADLRTSALASMRRDDATATLLADILTNDFPSTSGVPAMVEETTVDGTPAWVLIEVYAVGEGSLDRWRLWVLERPTGRIISSSTYR